MSDNFNQALADKRNPYWLWGPLAFSIFYFLPLIFNLSVFIGPRLVGVFGIYLAFLALYKKAIFAKGEKVLLPTLGIIFLCVLGTYITPGTQALFGYAAYFCGFNFRFNKGIQGLTGILLAIVLSAELFSYRDAFFLAPALIVSIGLFFFGQAERKDRLHKQKENISQQKVEHFAAIAERERIARDLHDLVGHSLSSIALKANLAEKLISKNHHEKAATEIHEVASLSREILAQVREAVSGIKQYNLPKQIEKLVSELESHNITVKKNIDLTSLPPHLELPLIFICTELVTNILKHSSGDQVLIDIQTTCVDDQVLALTIKDNGQVLAPNWGNGLTGIKERCQLINAEFTINTQDGFCARITLGKE
ncbi:sensor histidine kinase [Thalassotalea sediminis]|uniref:sensor histidine kinase n=1 Tax=Thalassotalea sediminis TaxID=1759089 RepID=UPI002572321E|nr:sensor histidine kinase [Thalassotalea sediminis]